jgi:uncharacterized membrane protein YbhN (UPF0104 family)
LRILNIKNSSIGFRIAISAGVSFAIISLMLALFSKGVSPIDRPQLYDVIHKSLIRLVLLYLICLLSQGIFRAIRYRILLAADRTVEKVPSLPRLLLVTTVRNMTVDMLPARLGEISYIAMLNRGYQVEAHACISSLAVSFAFDLIALIVVILILIGYQLAFSTLDAWSVPVLLFLIFITGLVIFFLYRGIRWTVGLLDNALKQREQSYIRFEKISQFLHKMTDSIENTFQTRIFFKILIHSVFIRFFKYAGLFCLFKAVVIRNFGAFNQISALKVLLTLIGAEGSAGIPMPTFMSFGTYEAGGVFALSLLGFSQLHSMLVMLAIHIWSQIGDYSFGMIALIIFISSAKKEAEQTGNSLVRKRVLLSALSALFLFVGIALIVWQYRMYEKMGSLTAPAPGVPVSSASGESEYSNLRAILDGRTGFMVWSSNRFGNHDILYLSTDSPRIRRLTTHPHVDYFPRISPDGTKVVFSRSQKPWVSYRNEEPWDVYLIELASGKEWMVAKDGFTPTWSEDGRTIYFQRNGDKFVSHDLESGIESVMFEAGKNHVPPKVQLQTPSFSKILEKMAVTLRGEQRLTGLIDLSGRIYKVGGGCQLAFSPDALFVYYVDGPGHMGNAIYRVFIDNLDKRERWIDLPGEYSHEYFPRLSNDGKFLIFGASTGGHEHDSADYEIYIWRSDSPASSAKRITFHTGNDNWPDLYINT